MGPPDLHGFYKWVFDSLEVLNDFTRQVVVSCRETGIRRWARWLREDLGSRPYAWLRPDFVSLKLPGFWLNLILLTLSSARLGCPFSGGLVILSRILLVICCLKNLSLIFLGLRVGTCRRLRRQKKGHCRWIGWWAWTEVKALLLPCFCGLAILLELVETNGVRPHGFLDPILP